MPGNWAWNDAANEKSKAEAEEGDSPTMYIWDPERTESPWVVWAGLGFISAPMDLWYDIRRDVAAEEGNEYEHQDTSLGGVPAVHTRMQLEERTVQEAYLMPAGNDWAFRVTCSAAVGMNEDLNACETLVQSVRLE